MCKSVSANPTWSFIKKYTEESNNARVRSLTHTGSNFAFSSHLRWCASYGVPLGSKDLNGIVWRWLETMASAINTTSCTFSNQCIIEGLTALSSVVDVFQIFQAKCQVFLVGTWTFSNFCETKSTQCSTTAGSNVRAEPKCFQLHTFPWDTQWNSMPVTHHERQPTWIRNVLPEALFNMRCCAAYSSAGPTWSNSLPSNNLKVYQYIKLFETIVHFWKREVMAIDDIWHHFGQVTAVKPRTTLRRTGGRNSLCFFCPWCTENRLQPFTACQMHGRSSSLVLHQLCQLGSTAHTWSIWLISSKTLAPNTLEFPLAWSAISCIEHVSKQGSF